MSPAGKGPLLFSDKFWRAASKGPRRARKWNSSRPGPASSRTADFAWAALATIAMGALVEVGQGVSGKGHCRLRDLIPDAAGVLLGSVLVLLWKRIPTRPRPG